MRFHITQFGVVGRPREIEAGMAGQRTDLFQRYLDEVKSFVQLADELGYSSYGHNEHHLQIEGFEETNHPGMMSLFIGLHSKRMKVGNLGYVLPTHNPVRVAEEIATLDQMLKGRLLVSFVRGYQLRWTNSYSVFPGLVTATSADLARARDERDTINREIFEESVRIIKRAWTQETFSYSGKYWTFPPPGLSHAHPAYLKFGKGVDENGAISEIGIAPRPYQNPHPQIYGAFSHSMRTIKFWAREGGKPIVMAGDLDFCQKLWDTYGEEAAANGRDVPRDEIAAFGGTLLIGKSRGEAERDRESYKWLMENWILPFGQDWSMEFMGTPDDISRQIEQAQKRLGFNECWLIIGQGYLEPDRVREHLELFAAEVMPRFAKKDESGVYV